MSETTTPLKARFGAMAYASSIYFLVVGVAYLWRYWSAFSINILEYLALSDVLKHAAFPIGSSAASALLGIVSGHFLPHINNLPPGAGRETKVGKFLIKHSGAMLMLFATAMLGLYALQIPDLMLVIAMLVGVVVSVSVSSLKVVQEWLPDTVRGTVVYFLCVLPLISLAAGESRALKIIGGDRFTYLVDSALEPIASLRLVGHAGDEYFFYEPKSKGVVMMKRPADKALALGNFRSGR